VRYCGIVHSMRKPFKKSLGAIPIEEAHGGSGKRQLILSKDDAVSSYFHAMTKGFLPSVGVFDWHEHKHIDEFFLVMKGTGVIEFKDESSFRYAPGELIYIPANLSHRIENTGEEENEFYFIRLDA